IWLVIFFFNKILHNQRWNTCKLSWAFRDPFGLFPSDEHFTQTKRVIADAIRLWSAAGNLKDGRGGGVALHLTDLSPITRSSLMNVRRIADIDIFFASFSHGDAESFDGRGGLVAHSSYPPLGIVHFDASEYWDLGGSNEIKEKKLKWRINKREEQQTEENNKNKEKQAVLNLRYVAVHEIGHALGLRHSTFLNSVMNRYYKMTTKENNQSHYNQIIKLSKDDEMAIEELFSESYSIRRCDYFLRLAGPHIPKAIYSQN
ncbi:ZnMc domain-containing protein, partial [Meloidogyne graminicola]